MGLPRELEVVEDISEVGYKPSCRRDRVPAEHTTISQPVDREALRHEILHHLDSIGLNENRTDTPLEKHEIRDIHRLHREAAREKLLRALGNKPMRLVDQIANGEEVEPESVQPYLVEVKSGTPDSDLFRFATMLWSIPVSQGYGRRLRFLVKDGANGKLIGIFALGDPVFNLRARDAWIAWDQAARREKLVNLMDAYVVGAVPPYSMLLGGKLVTSLIASREVADVFESRYGNGKGIISGNRKKPRLALVTVTSALGRSSMYNRLKLYADNRDPARHPPDLELLNAGSTTGFGHFQISNELFSRLRTVLKEDGHRYVDSYKFGGGPNWRIRVLRVGLEAVGLNPDKVLRHGIRREVYVMPIAANAREFLVGDDDRLVFDHMSVEDISGLAKARWIVPRSERRPEYRGFRRELFIAALTESTCFGCLDTRKIIDDGTEHAGRPDSGRVGRFRCSCPKDFLTGIYSIVGERLRFGMATL